MSESLEKRAGVDFDTLAERLDSIRWAAVEVLDEESDGNDASRFCGTLQFIAELADPGRALREMEALKNDILVHSFHAANGSPNAEGLRQAKVRELLDLRMPNLPCLTAERIRREAEATTTAARALLRRVEWAGSVDGEQYRRCFLCWRRELDGHAADCDLGRLLAGGGAVEASDPHDPLEQDPLLSQVVFRGDPSAPLDVEETAAFCGEAGDLHLFVFDWGDGGHTQDYFIARDWEDAWAVCVQEVFDHEPETEDLTICAWPDGEVFPLTYVDEPGQPVETRPASEICAVAGRGYAGGCA